MPKNGRPMKMFRDLKTFRDQKQTRRIVATILVVSGLGGATALLPPTHRHTEVAVEQPSAADAATDAATTAVAAAAHTPPVIHTPPVVTKDSSAQDIVKAIVGHGHASGLSEGQIKTVIATAKIESSFRPTVSGGVQPYGVRGPRLTRSSACSKRRPVSAPSPNARTRTRRSPVSSHGSSRRTRNTASPATMCRRPRSRKTRNCSSTTAGSEPATTTPSRPR